MLASASVQPESAPGTLIPEPVLPLVPVDMPAPAQLPDEDEPGATGEVVVTARSGRGDPLMDVNVQTYQAAQKVDDAVIAPVANAYKKAPRGFRVGLRHVIANLREPVVALNFILQGKPGKAAETLGRLVINSTVGILGILDVAKQKPFHLPLRRNGFANTLGFYGVGPGPFFFFPLIGPTTLRDLAGAGVDRLVLPIGNIKPFNRLEYAIPLSILIGLDRRIEVDKELQRQRATVDPYAESRRAYLQRRQAEIDHLRGRDRIGAPTAVPPAALPPMPVPLKR